METTHISSIVWQQRCHRRQQRRRRQVMSSQLETRAAGTTDAAGTIVEMLKIVSTASVLPVVGSMSAASFLAGKICVLASFAGSRRQLVASGNIVVANQGTCYCLLCSIATYVSNWNFQTFCLQPGICRRQLLCRR